MTKKEILIFIDWYEPGYKAGGPIQSVKNLVTALAHDFSFYIVTSDRDYHDQAPYKDVELNTWISLSESVNVIYLNPANQNFSTYRKILSSKLWNKILINGLFSPNFSILPLLATSSKKLNTKVILSTRGMLAPAALNEKPLKKRLFLAATNFLKVLSRVTIHATNAAEAEQIKRQLKTDKVQVISNLGKQLISKPDYILYKRAAELKVISIARISPEKNTAFIFEVLALLPTFTGNIDLDIYGPINDKAYWESCIEVSKQLPENISVNYKGSIVSAKVSSTIKQYHLLFLPSLGENYGHSIVEALANSRPVLISEHTPWQQLNARKAGWSLPLEHRYFTKALIEALNWSQEDFESYIKGSWQYAKVVLDQAQVVDEYKQLLST